jgi:hypothetical protein
MNANVQYDVSRGFSSAMRREQYADAARLIVECQEKGYLSEIPELLARLLKPWEGRDYQKLIRALGELPCLYCQDGRVRCDECHGEGHHGYAKVCNRCVGTGQATCAFCNGAGQYAIGLMPRDVWADVLAERHGRTERDARQALRKKLPADSDKRLTRQHQTCLRTVALLDRSRARLEACAVAANQLVESGIWSEDQRAKLVRAALKMSDRLRQRMRDWFGRLARIAAKQANHSQDSYLPNRLACAQERYFANLARSKMWAGTCMHRTLLHRLAA